MVPHTPLALEFLTVPTCCFRAGARLGGTVPRVMVAKSPSTERHRAAGGDYGDHDMGGGVTDMKATTGSNANLGRQASNESVRADRRPAVDRVHLARFTLGNVALEVEVLGLFAADAPGYLRRIEAAQDRREWIEAAHTLKGSARAVGAWRVAEAAEAIERLARDGDPFAAPDTDVSRRYELLTALAATLAEAIAEISRTT